MLFRSMIFFAEAYIVVSSVYITEWAFFRISGISFTNIEYNREPEDNFLEEGRSVMLSYLKKTLLRHITVCKIDSFSSR